MTRLIFVRHGESAANRARVFAGHTDAPLTDYGRAQAAAAAEYLTRFRIDFACASDLTRAYETASIIAARQGLSVTPDPAFREIFAGEWEGHSLDDLIREYAVEYGRFRTDIGNCRPTGGESVVELGERISAATARLICEHEGKTVLIGTHATSIRVMAAFWRGLPFTQTALVPWAMNASATVVEYEGGVPRVLLYGYNQYLGTLTSRMPAGL